MKRSGRGSSAGSGPIDLVVGRLVGERREAMKLTLQRVADMIGCAKSYLWLIERGRTTPSQEILVKLQHALGFQRGELLEASRWAATPADVRAEVARLRRDQAAAKKLAGILSGAGIDASGRVRGALDAAHRSGELRRLVERIDPGAGNRDQPRGDREDAARALPLEVPLINKVAAGYPREFTDLGYPARAAAEYVRVPDLSDPDAFACRVVGDSMLPEYREGDIVVFSPAKAIKSGMDCFARIEPDHESTFKRVYLEDGDVIRLQPLNPEYPARVLPREQVAGLYAAVSVTRSVG